MKDLKTVVTSEIDDTIKVEIPSLNLVSYAKEGNDVLDAVVEMCFSYALQVETAGLNLHKELE